MGARVARDELTKIENGGGDRSKMTSRLEQRRQISATRGEPTKTKKREAKASVTSKTRRKTRRRAYGDVEAAELRGEFGGGG